MTGTLSQPTNVLLGEGTKPPFLRRVRIQGYKSIAHCDVKLQPLTILVGRNGSGKSNFLDALGFLHYALRTNLTEAVQVRGGLQSLLCRTSVADHFSIEVELGGWDPRTKADFEATYQLTVSRDRTGRTRKPHEKYRLRYATNKEYGFETSEDVESVEEHSSEKPFQRFVNAEDHLFLNHIIYSPYVPVSTLLSYMRFYNYHPDLMRAHQHPIPGHFLDKYGSNIASVIEELRNQDMSAFQRVQAFLSTIVPDVVGIEHASDGDSETVRFSMHSGAREPWRFDAAAMSDGTLRILGALVSAFQVKGSGNHPTVVGIEEPETSLHPAATQALVDALNEATAHTQILLTTHSADLLADPDIEPSQVLVVRNRNGQTQIGPVDAASREIVRKELYTLADLQRMDQLDLDEADLERQAQSLNGEV